MPVKRSGTSDDSGDSDTGPDVKRQRRQQNQPQPRQHQNGNIDLTWGQKYVFSSSNHASTIPAGEESDFEDDADAMAYLNSVRQQASVIPHLLVAKKPQIGPQVPLGLRRRSRSAEDDLIKEEEPEEGQIEEGDRLGYDEEDLDRNVYDNGVGDARGWYEDGAYIAKAVEPPDTEEYDETEDPGGEDNTASLDALHHAYFHAQICQFNYLRAILRRRLPDHIKTTLKTSADPFEHGSRTNALWSKLIRTSNPHPIQIAMMDKDSILRILRVITGGKFLRRGYVLAERTSCWLWALLARMPDPWELTHVEIGWIRELGKRAVLLGRSLAEMAAMREEIEDGALGANEGVDASDSDEDALVDASIEDGDEVTSYHSEGTDSEHPHFAAAGTETTQTGTSPSRNNGSLEERKPQKSSQKTLTEPQDGGHETAKPMELQESTAKAAKDTEMDEEDVAMEISSSPSEVAKDESTEPAPETEILEQAKSRLLAYMDNSADNSELDEDTSSTLERSRMNTRATINMLLTVAGEFYGQRDLLEFREPFVGM